MDSTNHFANVMNLLQKLWIFWHQRKQKVTSDGIFHEHSFERFLQTRITTKSLKFHEIQNHERKFVTDYLYDIYDNNGCDSIRITGIQNVCRVQATVSTLP